MDADEDNEHYKESINFEKKSANGTPTLQHHPRAGRRKSRTKNTQHDFSQYTATQLPILALKPEVFQQELCTQFILVLPINISLWEGAIPHRILAPRPLPQRFAKAARVKMEKYIKLGQATKWDEPTTWCAPSFFVPKGDGKMLDSSWIILN